MIALPNPFAESSMSTGGYQEAPAVVPQYPTTTAGLLERILEEVLSLPPIMPPEDDFPAPKFLRAAEIIPVLAVMAGH